jgi:hypothetical protein
VMCIYRVALGLGGVTQRGLGDGRAMMDSRRAEALSGADGRNDKDHADFVLKIARLLQRLHEVLAKSLLVRMNPHISPRGCLGVCDVPIS